MADVHIFRPVKSAMQSGRLKFRPWVIEFEHKDSQYIEPLMLWTGSTNTREQVRLSFETREQAIAFAIKNGWTYRIDLPQQKAIKPKSYSDNFVIQ